MIRLILRLNSLHSCVEQHCELSIQPLYSNSEIKDNLTDILLFRGIPHTTLTICISIINGMKMILLIIYLHKSQKTILPRTSKLWIILFIRADCFKNKKSHQILFSLKLFPFKANKLLFTPGFLIINELSK